MGVPTDICCLLIWAVVAASCVGARELQDVAPQEVATLGDFRSALDSQFMKILFTKNITMSLETFTGMPPTCFSSKVAPEICDPSVVVYGDNTWPVGEAAEWTSAPGVFLDARFLRSVIIILRPVKLINLNILRVFDDYDPYMSMFGSAEGGQLSILGTTLWSPCGGRGPSYIAETLATALGPEMKYVVSDTDISIAVGQIRLVDASNTGLVELMNATIRCYNDDQLSYLPPLEIPESWTPGVEDVFMDESDRCQRSLTLGQDYRGTTAVTSLGVPCQAWNEGVPNNHTRTPDRFPNSGLGESLLSSHNFCRNPDASPGGVWCYATSGFRWQSCDVPSCNETLPWLDRMTDDGNPEQTDVPISESSTNLGPIIGGVIGGVVVLAFIAYLLYACWFRGYRASSLVGSSPKNLDGNMSSNKFTHTKLQMNRAGEAPVQVATADAVQPKNPEDDLRDALRHTGQGHELTLKEELGRGASGVVFRGVWKGMQVAVKTILFQDVHERGDRAHGRTSLQRACAEAAITFSLVHPNVVSTYHHDVKMLESADPGVERGEGNTSRDMKLYLVQEYCNGGNLAKAIRSRFFTNRTQDRPHLQHILQVAWEMAAALQYIHSKKIIHGDLNPNNVLLKTCMAPSTTSQPSAAESGPNASTSKLYSSLGRGFTTKVADFGLSLKMSANQTHVSNMQQGTPFYVAPEVQSDGLLTQKSDVYSFGVLLWELYNGCSCFKRTNAGFHITCPSFPRFSSNCPLPYAILSVACLNPQPSARPGLNTVVAVLEDMLTKADQLASPQISISERVQQAIDSHSSEPRTQSKSGKVKQMDTLDLELPDNGSVMSHGLPQGLPLASPPEPAVLSRSSLAALGPQANELLFEPAWQGVLQRLDRLGSGPALHLLKDVKLKDAFLLEQEGPALDSIGTNLPEVHARADSTSAPSMVDDPVTVCGMDTYTEAQEGGIHPMLTNTLDKAMELAHCIRRDGVYTSDEESDDFHDALEEIVSHGSLLSDRSSDVRSDATPSLPAATQGIDPHSAHYTRRNVGSSPTFQYTSTYSNSQNHPHRSIPNSATGLYPTSGPVTSLTSGALSDWDAVEAENQLVKDERTGRTHFRHTRTANSGSHAKARRQSKLAAQPTTHSFVPPPTPPLQTNSSQLDSALQSWQQGEDHPMSGGTLDNMMSGHAISGGLTDADTGPAGATHDEQSLLDVVNMNESFLGLRMSREDAVHPRQIHTAPTPPTYHHQTDSPADTTGLRYSANVQFLSSTRSSSDRSKSPVSSVLDSEPTNRTRWGQNSTQYSPLPQARAADSWHGTSSDDDNDDTANAVLQWRGDRSPGASVHQSMSQTQSHITSAESLSHTDRSHAEHTYTDPIISANFPFNRPHYELKSHTDPTNTIDNRLHSSASRSGDNRFGGSTSRSLDNAALVRVSSIARSDTRSPRSSLHTSSGQILRQSYRPLSADHGHNTGRPAKYRDFDVAGKRQVRPSGEFRPMPNRHRSGESANRSFLTDPKTASRLSSNQGAAGPSSSSSADHHGAIQENLRYIQTNGSYLFDTLDSPVKNASMTDVSVTDVVNQGWGIVDGDTEADSDSVRLKKSRDKSSSCSKQAMSHDDLASYGFDSLGLQPVRPSKTAGKQEQKPSGHQGGSSDESPLSMRGLNSVPHGDAHDGQLATFDEAANSNIDLKPQLRVHVAQAIASMPPRTVPQRTRPAYKPGNDHLDTDRLPPPTPQSLQAQKQQAPRPKSGSHSARGPRRSNELRVYVHPLLRNNKAAMAHVRDIAKTTAPSVGRNHRTSTSGRVRKDDGMQVASESYEAERPNSVGLPSIREPR